MKIVSLLLWIAALSLPAASTDSVESRLRLLQDLPLRWDNVEGAPEWVYGAAPDYNLWRRLHEIELAPGEHTCVRIPSYELLRLHSPRGGLSAHDVEVALSTGSGLLAFTETVPDEASRSLLVDPRRPYAMLAHIFRPWHHKTPIRLGVFTSRHVPLQEVAGYRRLVDLGGKQVRLTTSVEADALEFFQWEAGDQTLVTVRGRTRYLVETRYRYPADERKLPQTYHLKVWDRDNNDCLASLEYATSHETAHLVFADGEAQVVSRLEPAFFELPEDRDYRLTIEAAAPVYVRMRCLEKPEYLLPMLNGPDPASYAIADALRSQRFQCRPWEMREDMLLDILQSPLAYPAERVERAAMRLQRDNARTEGGMMATNLLLNAGAPRRDYPTIRERWREFVGFRTYYRDAMPEGVCLEPLKRAYFPARRLQETGRHREWLVMADPLIEASYDRMPLATFCPIQGSGNTTRYHLPDRSTYSIIRIVAQRERVTPADFWVRVDGEAPRRFRLVATPEVLWSETKPTQAEAALTLIEGRSLDAPASLLRDTEELAPAGYFEFLVPPHSRKIEIRDAANSHHLHVAVQYRTSDVFELSEAEYLYYVEKVGGQGQVLGILTEFLRGHAGVEEQTQAPLPEAVRDAPAEASPGYGKQAAEPLEPPAELAPGEAEPEHCGRALEELHNHWEPLRRFVLSRYRQFVDSVSASGNAATSQEWLDKADPLIDAGEYYLAERLVRHLYLYAEEPAIRQGAYERLDRIAQRHLDPEKRILNACVRVVVEPGPETAAVLCQLLREQGEPELALMLSVALPDGEATTRDLRLACSYGKQWWAHFNRTIGNARQDPVSEVWQGRRHWLRGQRSRARDAFRRAGRLGATWLDYIEATFKAREQVVDGSAAGLVEWARLERDHPGLRLWKQVSNQHVSSFRAGVTVRALEREKYFHAFVATPDEPLALRFAAPGRLRIECRPLHVRGSTESLEGWITIEGAARRRKLPIITNYPSLGLEIVGRESEQPGTLIWDEFSVGWNGRITLQVTGCRVLVRVLREVPEARCGHLPPLGYESAAWLFDREGRPRGDSNHHYRENLPAENVPAPHGTAVVIGPQRQLIPVVLEEPFANPTRGELSRLVKVMARAPTVVHEPPRQAQRAAILTMNELLWQREQARSETERSVVAGASWELYAQREYPELKSIHGRIVRHTFWEPLLNTARMAGLRETEEPGWLPENPDLLARMNLLPSLGSDEQLLSGTDSTVAMLTNREENKIRLRLRNTVVPFLVPRTIRVGVQLGDAGTLSYRLSPEEPQRELALALPPGQTSLRVSVLESEPNHFLRLGIDAEKERELYQRKTRRNHFVATRKEPVLARIDGPAWVRIDRWTTEGVVSEYRLLQERVSTLELAPVDGAQESLYRIHVLRIDPGKPFHPPPFTEREVAQVPQPLTIQPWPDRAVLAEYDDEFHLGAQEDGTWSLGLSYHSRRATEEDIFGAREPERFVQGDLTHRYYSEDLRSYFRTSVLGRVREHGGETLGVEHSVQHRPFDYPLNFSLTGTAFWQDGEWALGGRASMSMTHEWSPKWSHTPSLSIFFREMSLSDGGDHPERIDQDVFSEYKSDHRRGIRLRDEFAYRPWRDTRLFGGAGISTNENFALSNPDSFTYWAGLEQLLGPVRVRAKWQGYRFFADDDRAASVWRNRLRVEAIGDHWLINQDRLEAGIGFTHFVEEQENAFGIFLNWHFGEGRMWRDFRPSERPFHGVRRLRIPQDTNNALRRFSEPPRRRKGGPRGEGRK